MRNTLASTGRLIAAALLAIVASGCAINTKLLDKQLENRLVTTVPGDEAFVVSKWGPISIGAKLADIDAQALKQLRELLALLRANPATLATPPATPAGAPAAAPSMPAR